MGELAKWQSHKIVKAGKLLPVQITNDEGEGTSTVMIEDVNGAPAKVIMPTNAFARGTPQPGDYIVIYADGYRSWSPAQTFEEGYTRLP